MIRWLVVALLLVYGVADAGMSAPRKLVVAATGGSCSTQSVLLNQTGTGAYSTGDIYDTTTHAFRVTGNGKKLYSVKLKTHDAAQGSSATYTIYVNTALDFSGTNVDSFSITSPGASSTEFTGLSTNQPTLSNGTYYYIGYNKQNNSWGTRSSLLEIPGTETTPTNNGWTAPTLGGPYTQASMSCLWAEVKVCD